ncbi:NCS2 family permease [Oscillospiraceae bacterium OttesenSCG-928-G22]|nr:NCS2 family permease [Oscillospiraceae bacterium OttesenSCG-928-G22]
MEKLFKLKEHGTNVRTEVVAGLTTFFTMAYIIFVNPNILSATGMNPAGVFVATCISAAIGTLMMAFVANLPYAQAPGMGLNAFFAYTVCLGMGFAWQEALAMVFICGIFGIIITVTKVRKALIAAIPANIQYAIGGGIGLFIAYIGFKNAGIIEFGATAEGVTAGAAAVPALVNFTQPGALLAVIGIVLTVVLLLLNIKGALFISIIACTVIGIPMGVTQLPTGALLDVSAAASISDVAFQLFGNPGFGSLFADPSRFLLAFAAIVAFLMTDVFDTIGTLIGTGRSTGFFDEEEEKQFRSGSGFKSRMERALFADLTATTTGALLGTSNVTTYVESASGIAAGGRTGLSSLVTGILLLLCVPFASLVGIVPAEATAPALIVVGILMLANLNRIEWGNLEEAVPAFFTITVMAFGYSISSGIAAGFIFYIITKAVLGKAKEIHPIVYGSTAFFLLNFIITAVRS